MLKFYNFTPLWKKTFPYLSQITGVVFLLATLLFSGPTLSSIWLPHEIMEITKVHPYTNEDKSSSCFTKLFFFAENTVPSAQSTFLLLKHAYFLLLVLKGKWVFFCLENQFVTWQSPQSRRERKRKKGFFLPKSWRGREKSSRDHQTCCGLGKKLKNWCTFANIWALELCNFLFFTSCNTIFLRCENLRTFSTINVKTFVIINQCDTKFRSLQKVVCEIFLQFRPSFRPLYINWRFSVDINWLEASRKVSSQSIFSFNWGPDIFPT